MFDAEHFFDGYKANPAYAIECIRAAYDAGARWVVLCDTNGGTLPHEIAEIVDKAAEVVPGASLGIHCHNDTENAVANSLAAVNAGARQIQGTLNGLGERCGNANLVSLIGSLTLKTGYDCGIDGKALAHLTHVSRMLDERLNRAPSRNAAYVGESAFAHKGGLHVSAVAKDPRTYEHIEPSLVGNRRHIVVSDQAGRSNVLARFAEIGLDIDPKEPRVDSLIEQVKAREFEGYAYDGAEASFELLARRVLGEVPVYFELNRFRVMDDRRWNARGDLVTESEATVTVEVGGRGGDDGRQRQRPGERPRPGAAQGAAAALPAARGYASGRLQGAHPHASGGHRGGYPRADRVRGRQRPAMGYRRGFAEHHRRVLHGALRRHHLEALSRALSRDRLARAGPRM